MGFFANIIGLQSDDDYDVEVRARDAADRADACSHAELAAPGDRCPCGAIAQ